MQTGTAAAGCARTRYAHWLQPPLPPWRPRPHAPPGAAFLPPRPGAPERAKQMRPLQTPPFSTWGRAVPRRTLVYRHWACRGVPLRAQGVPKSDQQQASTCPCRPFAQSARQSDPAKTCKPCCGRRSRVLSLVTSATTWGNEALRHRNSRGASGPHAAASDRAGARARAGRARALASAARRPAISSAWRRSPSAAARAACTAARHPGPLFGRASIRYVGRSP